jgi:hypothetical protein
MFRLWRAWFHKLEDQMRLPGGRLFRLRRVTWKSRKSHHPQVTKGACYWFGPTSSGSFTPVPLRGPAAIRHPWRGAALAASMPLGPLRETCVQPAPKSRFVVFGRFVSGEHKQIKCRAKASRLKPVPLTHRVLLWDRLQPGMDAERPALHVHAERGHDQLRQPLPNGRAFRLRRVTWKSTPSNQGCLLPVWPDFVGFLHSGLAPWARAERTSMS